MKEIADMLHISVRTVEFHKSNIVEQLGLRTTAELTRYALDHAIAV
jgi:DNA-binding NarL/FixJ family response regulator